MGKTTGFSHRVGFSALWAIFLGVALVTAFPVPAITDEADIFYATQTLNIQLDPTVESRPAGKIFVASRLTILAQKPGWLRVELRGWYQAGAERVLYALPGKRILVAALSPAVVDNLRPLDTVNDPETNISWKGAAFEGWIRDEAVTTDLNSIWKSARDLFATRCTVCHQRRIPHKYTANQWVSLLKVMGPRTGLPMEKQRLILTYLQNHAKDTVVWGQQ